MKRHLAKLKKLSKLPWYKIHRCVFWAGISLVAFFILLQLDGYLHTIRLDLKIGKVTTVLTNQKARMGLYMIEAKSFYGRAYRVRQSDSFFAMDFECDWHSVYPACMEPLPFESHPGFLGNYFYNFLGEDPSARYDRTLGCVAVYMLVTHLSMIIPLALLVFCYGFFLNRYSRKYAKGHCPSCGYDLRQLPDASECPECGNKNPSSLSSTTNSEPDRVDPG